jgi:hypothetical protein
MRSQTVGLHRKAVGKLEQPVELEVEGVPKKGGVGKDEARSVRGLGAPVPDRQSGAKGKWHNE